MQAREKLRRLGNHLLSEHGMAVVLVLLCAYYSYATYTEHGTEGETGGVEVSPTVLEQVRPGGHVLIVGQGTGTDAAFAAALRSRLGQAGVHVTEARGEPPDVREEIERLAKQGAKVDAIVATPATGPWRFLDDFGSRFPALGNVPILRPRPHAWPTFLTADNLRNVANQIAVIAILAIGMTFVVLTGGIDLSVGSLIALSAVTATWMIREWAGGTSASPMSMVECSATGVFLCASVGLFSGALVTFFGVAPFIVTLAVMLIARGQSEVIAKNQSIYQLPESFVWLGLKANLLGVPNGVVLMAVLYLLAHIILTRTVLGRYIYAVGGNAEAARLSGVPVRRVLLFVYALSGALAGLGGIVLASQLRSGVPTFGEGYELFVVAAVVVGGTSLSGGEGTIFGTLVGAFIIAVIRNGMNLTGVESNRQKIVLGAVILGAVLLDRLKRHGWRMGITATR